jgi:hypothetical protein
MGSGNVNSVRSWRGGQSPARFLAAPDVISIN